VTAGNNRPPPPIRRRALAAASRSPAPRARRLPVAIPARCIDVATAAAAAARRDRDRSPPAAVRRRSPAAAQNTNKQVFWHSSAHVLGQALELEFGVDLTIGPSLEEGFYYDCFMARLATSAPFFPPAAAFRFRFQFAAAAARPRVAPPPSLSSYCAAP